MSLFGIGAALMCVNTNPLVYDDDDNDVSIL